MLFVGADRASAVEDLMAKFDEVRAGGGPLAVCLHSETGLGKTRVVHEFYARLARDRQGAVPYWPAGIGGTDELSLLEARKLVNPPWRGVAGTAEIPWFWWGMECLRTGSGSNMAALLSARSQFETHVGALHQRIEMRRDRREFALNSLGAAAAVVGVVVPGVGLAAEAINQGSGMFARWRSRRQLRGPGNDTVVGGDQYQLGQSGELAEALADVAAPDLPVVLFVDDAHWADFALVNLLRRIQQKPGCAVLIVATAWTHALKTQDTGGDFRTFGEWWSTIADQSGVDSVSLAPMPDRDLGDLVLEIAPRTDPQIVGALVDVADGNPLVLRLILGLEAVRRDAEDGAIDSEPAAIARLPRDVRTIFSDLFDQLPVDVRRVLALLSMQGPSFDPAFVEEAATALRMRGIVDALRSAQETYGWIHPAEGGIAEFTERARYDIALESNQELFDDEQIDQVRRRVADQIVARRSSPEWLSTPVEARRLLLDQLLGAVATGFPVDPTALAEAAEEAAGLARDRGDLGRSVDLARFAVQTLEASGEPDSAATVGARRFLALVLAESGDEPAALEELGAAVVSAEQIDEANLVEVMDDFHDLVAVVDEFEQASPPVVGGTLRPVLAPYGEWATRAVPELTSLQPGEVAVLLAEVVDAEGPVSAERAYQLLRVASGASRLGAQIHHALDRGVNSALRRGLISASPWSQDSLRRVLDRPGPGAPPLRELGSRDVVQVPAAEIGALARAFQATDPELVGGNLKRAILDAYGLTRLTPRVDAHLTGAIETAERRNVHRPLDEVTARAGECGVADEFDAWLTLFTDLGWTVRAWPGSVTATPLGRRSPTFVHLAPLPGGCVKARVDDDALATLEEFVPGAGVADGWAVLDLDGSARLRSRLAVALGRS